MLHSITTRPVLVHSYGRLPILVRTIVDALSNYFCAFTGLLCLQKSGSLMHLRVLCCLTGDAQRAEAVLIRMANLMSSGRSGNDLEMDIDCWNGVLVAWAKSGHEDATERTATVIQWLQEMSSKNDGKKQGDGFLDVTTYNALLSCFARSPNPQNGARLAQDLLDWMEKEQEKVGDSRQAQPDGDTYLACIAAWRNAKNPVRAQAVMDKLCDKVLTQRQHQGVERATSLIDRRHFNIVMASWAESMDRRQSRKEQLHGAYMAHELLERMIHDFAIQPDVVTFNTLINAWATRSLENANIATTKAQALLEKMKEQCRMGNVAARPNQTTYNSMIATLSRSTAASAPDRAMELFREMLDMDLAPDRKTYNTLMALFSRHGRPDKVQKLFQEMVNGWKAGDQSLKPHFKVYTTLLQAWSKAGEPEETAKVLKEMISKCESRELNGSPTVRDFDTVLQAWMRSKRPDAPEHAARGLVQMEQLAKSGRFDCWPKGYSYSSVISTFMRSRQPNAGEGAMEVFRRFKEVYQRTRDASLRPTASDYAQVMIALSFSPKSEASRQIENLLMEIASEDESFWSESNVGPSYYRLTQEISESRLPKKEALLSRLNEILDRHGLTPTKQVANPRESTRRVRSNR
jgi:pentatricopeptide repeat protein